MNALANESNEWDTITSGQYDSWQEAYYSLMMNYYDLHCDDFEVKNNMVRFETFDLNGDGVPELVFSPGDYHYADVSIFTFSDGNITFAGTLTGSWGKIGTTCGRKYICNKDSHMGTVQTDYYQLNGNCINRVVSFVDTVASVEGPNYYKGYKIDGNIVSEEEYNDQLQAYSVQKSNDSPSIGQKNTFSDIYTASSPSAAFGADKSWQGVYYNEILDHYDPDDGSFALYDINCDAVPELFIRKRGTSSFEIEIYTYANHYLSLCDTLYGYSLYILPQSKQILCGSSFMPRGGSYGYNESSLYQLNGVVLTKALSFGTKINADDGTVIAYTLNDNTVSYSEYLKYEKQYNFENLSELCFNTIQALIGASGQELWSDCVRGALGISQISEPWKRAYIAWLEDEAFLVLNQRRSGADIAGTRTNYALIDFDQNGIPELVTADKGQNYDYDQPQVYTYSNGQMIQVSEYVDQTKFGSGWWSIYSPLLYVNTQYGYYYCNYESTMLFFKYDGIQFELKEIFQQWDNDYRYNGYSTTKENYEKEFQKYKSIINTGFKVDYAYDIADITPVVNYKKAEQPVVTTSTQTTRTTSLTAKTTPTSITTSSESSFVPHDVIDKCTDIDRTQNNIIAAGRFECRAGDTIWYPVYLYNNTGYAAGGLTLYYDSALSPILDSNGKPVTEEGDALNDLIKTFSLDKEKRIVGLGIINGEHNETDSGVIYYVKIKIPDNAKSGTIYPITLEVYKWLDEKMSPVNYRTYDGWIRINDGTDYIVTGNAPQTTKSPVQSTMTTTTTTTATTSKKTNVTTQTRTDVNNLIAIDAPDARGIKVVRLFSFYYEPPTRINYYSHDSRTFKESGGLKDQSSKLRISKYYVNPSNYYCDANGNPIGSYLFDEKETVPSAVPPFEIIEKDITPYTHPFHYEDSPYKVWTSEIKAQWGENYTSEQELKSSHVNRYKLGAYYFPSEQSDSDFMIGTGEPICIGHFNVYIGVKGDFNLDNVVSAEDADLTEDYYTNYYVSMRRDTKLSDNPEFDGEYGLVFFLINVNYRDGRTEDDPFEDPPKVDMADAHSIRQFCTEKDVSGSNCNWTDIVGYDIPGVTAVPVTSIPTYTTTTTRVTTTTTTITTTTTTTTVFTTTTPSVTTTTLPALQLNTASITLTNGDQFTITANRDDVTFRSNNPDVAIVSQLGVVTAVGVGQAIISVYDAEANVVQVKVEVTLVTTTTPTTTHSEPPQSIAGDLNGDKSLSVADAVLLTRYISEALPKEDIPPSDSLDASDLDKDGLLTIIDVMLILREILK